MKNTLLVSIDHLYTCDDADTVLANAYVHIADNRIVSFGPMAALPEIADATRIDLSGTVVTPGLINTHHHFFQHLTRAVPYTQKTTSLDWLGGSYPIWAEIDAQMMYAACLGAACELLQTGATTSADCSYLLPETDGEMAAAEMAAVRASGIRFHFHRGCMPTIEGDLEERLKPLMGARLDRIIDDETVMMRQMEKAIKDYHDDANGSMCRVALGPTGVTYAKPAIMGSIADLAGEAGCGLHTHFHPRQDERDAYGGGRPINLLVEQGWIRPGTWFAHSTNLDAEDIALVVENGVGIAHCPHTIVRLGYGLAPIGAMRAAGVKLGIGVDGAASNDTGGMLGDVRLAMLLHRIGRRPDADPPSAWMTPYDTLKLATRGGADVLGRDDIGRIAPGTCADIVAFPLNRLSCAGAVADPLGALLMSGTDPYAAMTMVNGIVRVLNGAFVDIDESAVIGNLNAAASRMLQQAIEHTGIRFDQQPPAP